MSSPSRDLPPAPQHAGWYHLQLLYRNTAGQRNRRWAERGARLRGETARAIHEHRDSRQTISAREKAVEVPIALRNPGSAPWLAKESRVGLPVVELGWPDPCRGDRVDRAARGRESERRAHHADEVAPPPGSGIFHCAFTLV